jgi:hypothetical protein
MVLRLLMLLFADSFHPDDRAIRSSGTSVLTRATRRHIPEHGILHISSYLQDKIALILDEENPHISDPLQITQTATLTRVSVVS